MVSSNARVEDHAGQQRHANRAALALGIYMQVHTG